MTAPAKPRRRRPLRGESGTVLAPGIVGLLGAILRGTPKLVGAACRNHPGLFDGDDVQAALHLCAECPVLAACRSWAEQDPTARRGVIGGHVYDAPDRRLR